jgi:hypothetical protein
LFAKKIIREHLNDARYVVNGCRADRQIRIHDSMTNPSTAN